MIKAYCTKKSGKKYFSEMKVAPTRKGFGGGQHNVVIDSSQRFQKHMGFGGAFTEATLCAISVLSEEKKREVINAYFSKDGNRYNLSRLPIHSTDFSERSRVYIEDGDKELNTFDTSWDDARFQLYLDCAKVSGGFFNMISPWSPPAFMKDNQKLSGGGKLMTEFMGSWAEYICKFIEDMHRRGINVDCVSVQNEPEAVQTWESCIYTAEEEALFIRDHLYPALKNHGLEDVKIVLWDHNRDKVVERSLTSLSVEGVNDLVWGIGYHWYCSEKHDNLAITHALYPDKAIFLTECCVELAHDSTTGKSSYAGIWEHGERYGKQIINDLNNYSQGWIDWNLCLDEMGGPNHVGNYCEAPIIIDKNTGEVSYMSSYYYIGHFSRFIEVGATRIFCGNDIKDKVYSVAYINPDGKKIVVIENTQNKALEITLTLDGQGTVVNSPAHSIITLVIE